MFPANTATQNINNQLIEDVINQKENMVNLVLQQIYRLPLAHQHPIITDTVDALALQELLQIHYVGQGAALSVDTNSYGASLERVAYGYLQMLTAGKNVYIPGVAPVQNSPGFITPQAIVLPGETLIELNPQIISKVYTFINKEDKKDIMYKSWSSNSYTDTHDYK